MKKKLFGIMREKCIKEVEIVKIYNGLTQPMVSYFGLYIFLSNVFDLEHFIVWMRISAMNKFRKLWGKIETKLEIGEYVLQIENSNYK